jgi:hypothetical protein
MQQAPAQQNPFTLWRILSGLAKNAAPGSPGWWYALAGAVASGLAMAGQVQAAGYVRAVIIGVGGLVVLVYTHEAHSTKRADLVARGHVAEAQAFAKSGAKGPTGS